eukprot:13090454-Alexandrium_andersonii.AAC.1
MSEPARRLAASRCRASLMGASCFSAQSRARPTWGNFPRRYPRALDFQRRYPCGWASRSKGE